MKNKTYLPILGIALFLYIFELRILDQLNITSNQYFVINKFHNSIGREVFVVDLTFIFLIILLILYIFPNKLINKINSSIINLILWVVAFGVFLFETNIRPKTVNGSIEVSIFDVTYQHFTDVYETTLNSLVYLLILILIANIFLIVRTKNKFTLVNIIFIVVVWLEYMNELKKFPLEYVGSIKSNLFRTLFVNGNITIIHYTVFLILLPILLNTLVLVNKRLKKASKNKDTSIESTYPANTKE